MLTQSNSLPPDFQLVRFMSDLLRPDLDAIHLADGENFADEIAHSPFPCVDASCEQERCVAYQERVLHLFARGLVPCTTCGMVICARAKLECSSGCAA